MIHLDSETQRKIKVPYALRRVPAECLSTVLPLPLKINAGDIALAEVETIGKNNRLELTSGRNAMLHVGDRIAVVFGNRYATQQFEGYAGKTSKGCDLMSIGGLCGQVKSKHAGVSGPTKLRLLGLLGDSVGYPSSLRHFPVEPTYDGPRPRVVVVCGSAMDSGKTHAAMSLVIGLKKTHEVAGVKLTGTAAGKDTWHQLDAGACVALNHVDGGFESTYMCSLDELLDLNHRLVAEAAAHGAEWVVMEIADGLFERETAALLQSHCFTSTVDAWIFSAGDPLAVHGGVGIMHGWGLKPVAVSGLVSMSPLGIQEAEAATGLRCLTAQELQAGVLNDTLLSLPRAMVPHGGRVECDDSPRHELLAV
ncbi:MAG TPA: DUF1611 domain-containing protein [Armatimonadota bacterium]|jgi:hypothetical protein